MEHHLPLPRERPLPSKNGSVCRAVYPKESAAGAIYSSTSRHREQLSTCGEATTDESNFNAASRDIAMELPFTHGT